MTPEKQDKTSKCFKNYADPMHSLQSYCSLKFIKNANTFLGTWKYNDFARMRLDHHGSLTIFHQRSMY